MLRPSLYCPIPCHVLRQSTYYPNAKWSSPPLPPNLCLSRSCLPQRRCHCLLLAIQVIVQNKNDIILIHTSPIAWMPWWNNLHNDMNYLIHMATLFVNPDIASINYPASHLLRRFQKAGTHAILSWLQRKSRQIVKTIADLANMLVVMIMPLCSAQGPFDAASIGWSFGVNIKWKWGGSYSS